MTPIVLDIIIFDPLVIKFAQDLLRSLTQLDTQMVDQLQFTLFVNACKQRHLGICRTTLHQRSARVVADTADHGSTDTGRADHRMRFTAKRFERLFQRIKCRTGISQHLFTVADDVQLIEAQSADDNDVAIVIIAARRRAFGQTGIGGLHQDYFVSRDAGVEDTPQL